MASAAGYRSGQELTVKVVIPQINFSGLGNTTASAQKDFFVYLTVPGAINYFGGQMTTAVPITVNLNSSEPGVATVPATVTIPAGNARSETLRLTGIAAGSTTVTASGNDLRSTSNVITIHEAASDD
jgi:hypothetical protein